MEDGSSLAPVLLVVGLAFLVPILLARFPRLQLPVVVGEILAGMLIGRSGLNLVHEDSILEVLAALGFAFLMFLSGLEIDFSMLSNAGRDNAKLHQNPLILGLLILAGTITLAMLIALVMSMLDLVASPWLPALILSTTSLGIVLPVLREKGQSSTLYGQTLLLAALIADFVTMVLITVVVAVLSGGLTLEVLLVGVLLVAFLLAARFMRQIVRFEPLRRTLEELAHTTAQIKVRGALAVMFAFVVLSQVLGAEVILGAFLAGALISLVSSPEDPGDVEARHKLDAIGFGFIIPIFFIMVGVRFDLPALLSSASALILFPVLLVAAYAVKVIPSLLLRSAYSQRQSLAAGVLLSSRLSLIIAASAIGLRLGIINSALNADIILVAIVTSTLSPILFSRILPARKEEAEPRTIVVVGASRTGTMVAQRLVQHHDPVLLVDTDPVRIEQMQKLGFQAMVGDAATPAGLMAAGVESARGIAVATSDDEYNLRVCRLARGTFGVDHLVAYVRDATRIREFEAAGVHVVNPVMASASVMDGLLRLPDAYQLLTTLDDNMDVVEIKIRNPECAGRRLSDMRLPGDVLVLAIRRDGDLFVPHGHDRLQSGDHVTILGDITAVIEATEWLQQGDSQLASPLYGASTHDYYTRH